MSSVSVTLPDHPDVVRVIRSVAGRAADLAGLGFDRFEDLALAVDEAAAFVMDPAGRASIVTDFHWVPGTVTFTMRGAGAPEWPPTGWEDSIGGLVLRSVADGVEFATSDAACALTVVVSAGGPG